MKQQNLPRKIFPILFLLIFAVTPFFSTAQTGAPDLSFNSGDPGFNNPNGGANNTVNTIAHQTDGKIIIGGAFTSYNGLSTNYLVRVNADGSKDGSFNASGIGPGGRVRAVAIQADGKIIVGGIFFSYNGTAVNCIIRLNTDGSLDGTFTGPQLDYVNVISIQPDGKILVGGLVLMRLNADGSTDNSFNAAFRTLLGPISPDIATISLQPDGKMIIGGSFARYIYPNINQQIFVTNLIRLNPDGLPDLGFMNLHINGSIDFPGPNSNVAASAVQPDGKVVIGGSFNNYHNDTFNTAVHHILRLNTDGTIDGSFNVGTGTDVNVSAIVLQQDGRILISGNFATYNGIAANRLARLLPTGDIDNSLSSTGSNDGTEIHTIAPQPNGAKFLIGGSFTSYNNTGRNRIARIYTCTPTSSSTNVAVCVSNLPYNWNGSNYNVAGTYTKTLVNTAGCDSIATLVLSIGATAISGPTRACAYTISAGGIATYTVDAPPGSTFTWSVSKPISMHILFGQGTNTIIANYSDDFVSGTIYVRVDNAACNSTLKPSLGVSLLLPSTPGVITASANAICPFPGTANTARYTIRKVNNATSYNWSSQPGTTTITHINGTGINDTTVAVSFDPAFTASNITVQAANDCGASNARTFAISLNPAPPPSIVQHVISTTCPQRVYTYTIEPEVLPNNTASILWTVPTGGTIAVGQGGTTLSVGYNANEIHGYVTAQSINGCGVSSIKKLATQLPACPGSFARNVNNESVVEKNTGIKLAPDALDVKLSPNPSVNDFKLQVNTSARESISVKIFEIQGRFIKEIFVNPYRLTSFGSDLKAGTYIIEIRQGKNIKTTKLVKF